MSALIPECWLLLLSREMGVKEITCSNTNSFSLFFLSQTLFLLMTFFTALLGAQTKILSPTGDKVSILLLKCLASPFPPHLYPPPPLSPAPDLAPASSSSQLVWGFSSLAFPLLPFVYSHSKYFPPSPGLMMTHTCSRTLSGSPLPQKNLPS